MREYVRRRTLEMAMLVISRRCTVRQAAKVFCVSKSTAHKDLSERLALLDEALYDKVQRVLRDNWEERYLRGGCATRRKYLEKQ